MEHSPQRPVPIIPDNRLTIAYGSHVVMALVVLGALILQAAISINDWANTSIEKLTADDYANLADGYSGLYRFLTMWPFIGALFGIGRTLGDIPRDIRLALLLFLVLMMVVMSMLSLGLLVGLFAFAYVIASLYYGGKWFLFFWRIRQENRRRAAQ
jgi:hypothetical protein